MMKLIDLFHNYIVGMAVFTVMILLPMEGFMLPAGYHLGLVVLTFALVDYFTPGAKLNAGLFDLLKRKPRES